MPYKDNWRRYVSSRLANYRRAVKVKRAVFEALGGKCKRCGISDSAVLVIHHKYPENKTDIERARVMPKEDLLKGIKGALSTWYRQILYWESLLTHTSDLELLCANCHAKEHSR